VRSPRSWPPTWSSSSSRWWRSVASGRGPGGRPRAIMEIPMKPRGLGVCIGWRLPAAFGLALALLAAGPAAAATVSTLQLDGVISPITVRLVSGAIQQARAEGSQALVIQLDTPGGLERSMRSIVRDMLNAPIPVVVYVSPTGARAASAGAFITMAAHVAAMAPATHIRPAPPTAARHR